MKIVFARDEIGFSLVHVECDSIAEVDEFETWFNSRSTQTQPTAEAPNNDPL